LSIAAAARLSGGSPSAPDLLRIAHHAAPHRDREAIGRFLTAADSAGFRVDPLFETPTKHPRHVVFRKRLKRRMFRA
jgi:hypothetical protein